MKNVEKEYNKSMSLKFNLLMTCIMYVILILFFILIMNQIEHAHNDKNENYYYFETEPSEVPMFNNRFYRYASNGDIVKGTRARELYKNAIENKVDVIFHNASGYIIGNASGDSIVEDIKNLGNYKINYYNNSLSID